MENHVINNQKLARIPLSLIWNRIILKKLQIILTTVTFTIIGILYAIKQPDMYTSQATLFPANTDSVKIPSQLGGLAALAGVNLNSPGNNKTEVALEILKSKDFQIYLINKYNLKPNLLAVKKWDRNTQKIVFDEDIYEEQTNKWKFPEEPLKKQPTEQESVKVFSNLIDIYQDKITNIIRISVTHQSPHVARDILSNMIREINETIRLKDVEEMQGNKSFLQREIETADNSEIRKVMFSIIEEQTKNIMLASVKKDYVFKVIDKPMAPEIKSKPRRLLLVAIFSIFGLFISILLSIAKIIFPIEDLEKKQV